MSELLLAAAAMGSAAIHRSESPYVHNAAPAFASVTNSPTSRFELDATGVYLMPSRDLVDAQVGAHRVALIDSFDVLPAGLALTYEQAVALGRRGANPPEEGDEIDLGSAL